MASSPLRVWLGRLPLQLKVVAVALLCSLCVWLLLDYWQNQRLQEVAVATMSAELDAEATSARLIFDQEVKRYSQLVRLFAARGPVMDYLEALSQARPPRRGPSPDSNVGAPRWVPKTSQWRGLIDPEQFVLFSPQGEILDLYNPRGADLPDELRRNRHYYLQQSTGQSYFGNLDGRPHLMATADITDEQGRVRGHLMVVAPFDDGFLQSDTVRHFDLKGGVVALATGDPPRILTGSDFAAVPVHALVDDLKDQFLVRGTEFFDYGSSEVRLQLVVLLRNDVLAGVEQQILDMGRKQRASIAVVLVGVLGLYLYVMAHRISRLSQRVLAFSREELQLGEEKEEPRDQIALLEWRIARMSEEVLNGRRALLRQGRDLARMVEERTHDLQAAKRQAEVATRAKGQFLANMSHELRTPINGVLGTAQLLVKTPLTEEQQELIEILTESGEQMVAVVDDILDFSKLDNGHVRLERLSVNPRGILQSLRESSRKQWQDRGLDVIVTVEEPLPPIFGDPVRVSQVLGNLLANAIKFTRAGRIEVSVHVVDGRIHYAVADTGIGIPAEKLDTIFEEFSQADSSTTPKYGGAGLGLAITQRLVRLMRGELGVESQVGVGSTFFFSLPVEGASGGKDAAALVTAAVLAAPAIAPQPGATRVLLVEDNRMDQVVAKRMLARVGCGVLVAADGRQAVDLFAGQSFDLILMDVQMPVLDGLEATREIRRKEAEMQLRPVPIIALTANASEADRQRCLAAGMNDFLAKPVKLTGLTAAIERWSRRAVAVTES
jgi:signal transduction histidine kinase/ActR/RegA family two-component response regulator